MSVGAMAAEKTTTETVTDTAGSVWEQTKKFSLAVWDTALVPAGKAVASFFDNSVDISVDDTQLAAARTFEPQELADLEVYCSTLPHPVAPDLRIVKELGFVSSTYVRVKMRNSGGLKSYITQQAIEAESARSLAIGKLRSKAKNAGANAIFGIKLELETDGPSTMVIASGTAVVIQGNASVIFPATPQQALYLPVLA